jgi:hypothetical protein
MVGYWLNGGVASGGMVVAARSFVKIRLLVLEPLKTQKIGQ